MLPGQHGCNDVRPPQFSSYRRSSQDVTNPRAEILGRWPTQTSWVPSLGPARIIGPRVLPLLSKQSEMHVLADGACQTANHRLFLTRLSWNGDKGRDNRHAMFYGAHPLIYGDTWKGSNEKKRCILYNIGPRVSRFDCRSRMSHAGCMKSLQSRLLTTHRHKKEFPTKISQVDNGGPMNGPGPDKCK